MTFSLLGQHGGMVVNTVATQQEGPPSGWCLSVGFEVGLPLFYSSIRSS